MQEGGRETTAGIQEAGGRERGKARRGGEGSADSLLLWSGACSSARGAVGAHGHRPRSRRISRPRHPRAGGLIFAFTGGRRFPRLEGGGSGKGAGESGAGRGGPGGHTLKLPARDRKSRARPAPHTAACRAPGLPPDSPPPAPATARLLRRAPRDPPDPAAMGAGRPRGPRL